MSTASTVLGGKLQTCSTDPMTGFYRTGCCDTGGGDQGVHVVCVELTAAFLAFSQSRGNDLSTPAPHYGFPGLRPGDRWCLCAERWQEAFEAGFAPPVILEASHISATEFTSVADLKRHAIEA